MVVAKLALLALGVVVVVIDEVGVVVVVVAIFIGEVVVVVALARLRHLP